MPLITMQCIHGHSVDQYVHTLSDRGCRTMICRVCSQTMGPTLSVGRGLLYFEEGRPRIIEHMTHEPQVVTGHRQHQKLMAKHKVEWANRGTSFPGQWI